MLPTRIALVPHGVDLYNEEAIADFLNVASALQTQATRDVAPIWGVNGVVSAFFRLDDVPPGYFPLLLLEQVTPAHAYHCARQGVPMGAVQYGDQWSVLASHEMIEMLVDPWGDLTTPGWSPEDGWVEYVVEVCDPCQNVFYQIGDVPVSDFVTPRYYDPETAREASYSFTGRVRAPLHVSSDGYLSWVTADGSIRQRLGTGDINNIGRRGDSSLREWVDGQSAAPPIYTERVVSARSRLTDATRKAFVERLRRDIEPFVDTISGEKATRAASAVAPKAAAGAVPNSPASGGSQAERILGLLEEMANPAYKTYDDFAENPLGVEQRFGIDPGDTDLDNLRDNLPPRSHFAAVVRRGRTGTRLGDPDYEGYLLTHGAFGGA